MTLYVNTTEFEAVEFALISEGRPGSQPRISIKTFKKTLAFNENFRTLELLERFLRRSKVPLKKIDRIIVCSGPGSFTGIRVGISMTQALSFARGIPLVAIPKEKVPKDLTKLLHIRLSKKLIINYGQQPKITAIKK